MRRLSGSGAAVVDSSPARAVELLGAVDRYPEWTGDLVPRAEVSERDAAGRATRARATLHVALGPLNRDFDLELDVHVGEREVRLARVPHDRGDRERLEVDWVVQDGPPTQIRVNLDAELDVPRLLPVPFDQLSHSVAQGLVDAAKAELDASSPKASASSS